VHVLTDTSALSLDKLVLSREDASRTLVTSYCVPDVQLGMRVFHGVYNSGRSSTKIAEETCTGINCSQSKKLPYVYLPLDID